MSDTLIQPGYIYRAQVVSIHDADTVTVDIDLGLRVWMRKQKIRLADINAPELRRPDQAGENALAVLKRFLANSDVVIQTRKDGVEKYGRWLGVIYATDSGGQFNVNERLIKEGYAVRI